MTEQEIRTLLNKMLKDVFRKVLRLQEKEVSRATGSHISRTEMHMLEAIEDSPTATLTGIAEELGITKATASVSASRLEKKKYIEKVKSDKDKRLNILRLTEKGEYCCQKHRQFHETMIERLLKDFKISEYPEVLVSFQRLADFFAEFETNKK